MSDQALSLKRALQQAACSRRVRLDAAFSYILGQITKSDSGRKCERAGHVSGEGRLFYALDDFVEERVD